MTIAGTCTFGRVAWAETQTIETEGVAAVVNNDISIARDKAIALSKAPISARLRNASARNTPPRGCKDFTDNEL